MSECVCRVGDVCCKLASTPVQVSVSMGSCPALGQLFPDVGGSPMRDAGAVRPECLEDSG